MRSFACMVMLGFAVTTGAGIAPAEAGQKIEDIKARGRLVCGVREDTLGFARRTERGDFQGLEIDLCRAVAAAALGSSERVDYVALPAGRQLAALEAGKVDMLAAGNVRTLASATKPGVDFVVDYYFDRQGFLVPRRLGKRHVQNLNGASVCMQSERPTTNSVGDYFRANRIAFKPILFETIAEQRSAFFRGSCDIYAEARSGVYAARAAYAPNPADYFVLPESAGWEPLSLVVQQGDRRFAEIVRWSFLAMLIAEEHGISSENVDDMLETDSPKIRQFLGVSPGLGAPLGLDDRWAYTIIKQVGNYGESYDRNLGNASALRIPRGVNELASQGGLQYPASLR